MEPAAQVKSDTYRKIALSREHDGAVLRVRLDSPKGNVLDIEMMGELRQALTTEGRKPTVKAIVFEGSGPDFSYGASIPEHRKEVVAEMLQTFHGLFLDLIETARPCLALVRGRCLGGGLELASFCQWTFAHTGASLGQPEIRLGVFPPLASLLLPHRIGQARAEDLILTGRIVPAAEARDLGLVSVVSEDPEAALQDFLETNLLPHSAVALHHTVRASRLDFHRGLREGIAILERRYLEELMNTEDANEGVDAFLEKRPPVWNDR